MRESRSDQVDSPGFEKPGRQKQGANGSDQVHIQSLSKVQHHTILVLRRLRAERREREGVVSSQLHVKHQGVARDTGSVGPPPYGSGLQRPAGT